MNQHIDKLINAIQIHVAALSAAEIHGALTAAAFDIDDPEQGWLQSLPGLSLDMDSVPDHRSIARDAVATMRGMLETGRFSMLSIGQGERQKWVDGFLNVVARNAEAWREFTDAYMEAGKVLFFINLLNNPELYETMPVDKLSHAEFAREMGHMLDTAVRKIAAYRFTPGDDLDIFAEDYPLADWPEIELRDMPDELLMELLTEFDDRLSRTCIEECIRRGDKFAKQLHRFLDDEHLWTGAVSDGRYWASIHAVHILGAMDGSNAADALLAVLHRMRHDPEDVIWDWFDDHWTSFFQNKLQYASDALESIAFNPTLHWMTRQFAMSILADTASTVAPQQLETLLDRVADLIAEPGTNEDLLSFIGFILLDYPRPRHRTLLENLARRYEAIEEWTIPFSLQDVEYAFDRGIDKPDWKKDRDFLDFYNPAAIMARQHRWEEEGDDDRDDDTWENDSIGWESPEPFVRQAPKIGRNDPCPCGSGKKYKKCCMAG